MDIKDLKRLKREAGLTNAEISDLSSVPISTVNKIFSGATENPRYEPCSQLKMYFVKNKSCRFAMMRIDKSHAWFKKKQQRIVIMQDSIVTMILTG